MTRNAGRGQHYREVVVVVTLGITLLLASCKGGDGGVVGPDHSKPPAPPTPAVVVEVTAVDVTGAPVPSYWLVASKNSDNVNDSVASNETGVATLRIEGSDALDSVRIVLHDSAQAEPRFHPSLIRSIRLADTTRLSAVLFPTHWTIKKGRWAGKEMPMSLQRAIHPEGTGGSFSGNYLRNITQGIIASWHSCDVCTPSTAWTTFPIPVWFEPAGVDEGQGVSRTVTAADSVLFWGAVADMEARLGMDVFVPADRSKLTPETFALRGNTTDSVTLIPQSISVMIADRLTEPGWGGAALPTTFAGASERFGPGSIVDGGIQLSGTLFGVLSVQKPRVAKGVMEHEMMHALGFSHSCFPSAVQGCTGAVFEDLPISDVDSRFLTEWDVSYIEMVWTAHPTLIAHNPDFGYLEALDGERQYELGLSPSPTPYALEYRSGT